MRGRPLAVAALGALAIVVLVVILATSGSDPTRPGSAPRKAERATKAVAKQRLPLRTLIGQRLVIGLAGTEPDATLLAAVRAGEVGGIVLFPRNVPDAATTRRLTGRLQAAARAGGRPRLAIAVDQEGGGVKRVAWAPPTLSPPEMGRLGDAAARAQGLATGRALRGAGINVDLAPVVDVPGVAGSHIAREGRAFGTSGDVVAARAGAFARGLEAAGVAPVLKHFPGLGLATANTDVAPQRLTGDPAQRAAELAPYRALLPRRVARAVMLSWATYPAYDPDHLAGRSPAIARTLLRGRLGFDGVAFTDSLAAKAVQRVTLPNRMAVAAARADVDLLLWGGTGTNWRIAHRLLLAAARAEALTRPQLEASYARILAFKRALAR